MIKNNLIRPNFFWKILIWFWLSLVLIFVLTLFILQLSNDDIRYQKTPSHLSEQVKHMAGRVFKNLKVRADNPHQELPQKKGWDNLYLLKADGSDMLGKPIPDILSDLNKYVKNKPYAMSVVTKDEIFYGGVEIVVKNQSYRAYTRRVFSYLSGDYLASFFQEFVYIILISTFLISFPFSLLLAWLVVGPIKLLQQATRDISKDIKDRKKLKSLLERTDEFSELALDFDNMTKQLEQQLTARTQLISDVSHELRSPLTRMQIAIGIANNKLNTDGKSSELERIKLEAKRMNLMLTDLLDFSKIESLLSNQYNENVDMTQLITSLIADAEFEAEQVDVGIETSLQEGLVIKGNQVALLSCLENIIRNAIRYTKTKITLTCHNVEESGKIHISICDDGEGVPEEDVNKIFGAFYRPDLDRSRQSGGVGLGLSIAQKAIDAHSGVIWAENIVPTGFCVHIELPAERALEQL